MVVIKCTPQRVVEAHPPLTFDMGARQSCLKTEHHTSNGKMANAPPGKLATHPEGHACWPFVSCNRKHTIIENDSYSKSGGRCGATTARNEGGPDDSATKSRGNSSTPSIAAGVVTSNWQTNSMAKQQQRPSKLPIEPIHRSSGSLYSDVSSSPRTPTSPEYFLSDHSHEVLMQIIRCFPFATPKSSPQTTRHHSDEYGLTLPSSSTKPDEVVSAAMAAKKPVEEGTNHHHSHTPRFVKHSTHVVSNLWHKTTGSRPRAGTDSALATAADADKQSRCTTFSTLSAPGGMEYNSPVRRLCQVSVDTMAITALPLDCWLKERLKNWVQLSGHDLTIVPATNETLYKKQPSNSKTCEAVAYQKIMADPALTGMTPRFYKQIEHRGDTFIEIQNLLAGFQNVERCAVMDIKIGSRTFLESEVMNCCLRPDLFKKMVDVDPNEPTPEEREAEAITKLRYMQFRERESSTASLAFRIEAALLPGGLVQKSFKKVRTRTQILDTFRSFFGARIQDATSQLVDRLSEMRRSVASSEFFDTHEVVGSSILIIYDDEKAGAWMIDFAKSTRVPEGMSVSHVKPWQCGNHEDGYLIGLDNLIDVLSECSVPTSENTQPSTTGQQQQQA